MRRLVPLLMICFVLLGGVALAGMILTDEPYVPERTEDLAPTPEAQAPQAEGVEILITAAGDVTLGGNMRGNPKSNIYTKALDAHDGDLSYYFANVQEFFAGDDMTIVNFEGTLTTETNHKNNEFCFRAPPGHIEVLALGSIEAVAFENNHAMDFGQAGYDDTIRAFENAGIAYATESHMGVYEVKGVTIGMLAYQLFGDQYARLHEQVPKDIAAAKETCDIVIVSYHWGNELDFKPHDKQVKLGRATIDAGADLVLGHHSHRINPIEKYNGKYIVYSLANCSFSGNSQPNNMDTFLFQQKFIVKGDSVLPGAFRIIPCSISSVSGLSGKVSAENDFAVTPFEAGSEAANRVIQRMLDEGKNLQHAVTEYPTEWQ